MSGVRGRWRDTRPGAPAGRWHGNLVLFGFADLVGALLTAAPGQRGLSHLAVGRGHPGWDAAPPAADRGRTALTDEVLRVPLRELAFDSTDGVLRGRARLPGGLGPLRELGVVGGTASARPGSGTLVNHRAHDVLDLGEDEEVDREVRFVLDPHWLPGAREVVGGLLAGSPGATGLTHVAFGTSGDPDDAPRALREEALRRRLRPEDLVHERGAHRVAVRARLEIGEGPEQVREVGVLGGGAQDRPGTGLLVARVTGAPADRTRPLPYVRTLRLSLVSRTDVPVPVVTELDLAAARDALTAAGLVPGRTSDAEGPPGTVVGQDPAAGTTVPEGTAVHLAVAPAAAALVPGIVGAPEQAARDALAQAGLQVDEARRETRPAPAGVAPGTVLSVRPPEGSRLDVGAAVVLTLAVAPPVAVPLVLGLPLDAARVLVSGTGLVPVEGAARPSRSVPGTVVGQDPAAGVVAAAGDAVTLHVATPETVPVPDLTGTTREAAAAALAAAGADPTLPGGLRQPGLVLGSVTGRPAHDGETPGTVVAQVPAGGASAVLGSTVDVQLAESTTAPVPDLLGSSLEAAAAACEQVGLVMTTVSRPSGQQAGRVVAQSPPAGTSLRPGAAVRAVVGATPHQAVPDVRGTALEVAREVLLGAGFTVGDAEPVAGGGAAPGTVLVQRPSAGADADSGTRVALRVAAGVPETVGRPAAEARAAVEALGLVYVEGDGVPGDGEVGVVVEQRPAAGAAASAGDAVTVRLRVPAGVTVPRLDDLSLEDARRRLAKVGLVLGAVSSRTASGAAGRVLAQDPQAGTAAPLGTSVAVTVSAEEVETAEVPALVGLPADEAKQRCGDAGVVLDVRDSRSSDREAGTVLEQDPPAGEVVPRGTRVGVVVAAQDSSVEVPSFQGRPARHCLRLAADLGLALELSGPTDGGVGVAQQPSPGTVVSRGTPVFVVLAVPTGVPEVVGMAEQKARTVLERHGLRVVVEHRRVAGVAAGTVVDQAPAPPATALPGDTVTIGVAFRLVFEPDRPPVLVWPPGTVLGPLVPPGTVLGPLVPPVRIGIPPGPRPG